MRPLANIEVNYMAVKQTNVKRIKKKISAKNGWCVVLNVIKEKCYMDCRAMPEKERQIMLVK